MPRVSIVVPLFNMAETLEESVESCAAQTLDDYELLLIDDGSDAATAELAQGLAQRDHRLRYHRIEHTGNPGAVRNIGVRLAAGEYIQFLDADDLIAPQKLRVQLASLDRVSELAIAYSDYTMFWDDGNQRRFERLGPPHAEHWPHSLARQYLLYTVLHRFLFPREALVRYGAFDEGLTHAEDLDLWLRLLIRGVRFIYRPSILAYYRQHTSHSLRDPVGEVRGRRRVVENCRVYLSQSGLAERYASDLLYLETLADRPAWSIQLEAEDSHLRAGDQAPGDERRAANPVEPKAGIE